MTKSSSRLLAALLAALAAASPACSSPSAGEGSGAEQGSTTTQGAGTVTADPRCDAKALAEDVFAALSDARVSRISDVIPLVGQVPGLTVGTVDSQSGQNSHGRFDPRVFLLTPCRAITFTLRSPTFEVALRQQVATEPPSRIDPLGARSVAAARGEVLLHFKSVPWTGGHAVTSVFNSYRRQTRRHDSQGCGSCHLDGVAKDVFGLLPLSLSVGGVEAVLPDVVVNAMQTKDDEPMDGLFCVDGPKSDLEGLKRCLCPTPSPLPPECAALKSGDVNLPNLAPDDETCKRIDALLALRPVQDARFRPPSCVFP